MVPSSTAPGSSGIGESPEPSLARPDSRPNRYPEEGDLVHTF
ncbi:MULTISPECIES: hypothetical protein [Actinomyces]|nr:MULTISPECIES: hypothetical protein [Actinomyces]